MVRQGAATRVGDGGGRANIVGCVGSGLRDDRTGCGLGGLRKGGVRAQPRFPAGAFRGQQCTLEQTDS